MKAKLNLTIDDAVLTSIKLYADNKKISLSALVEDYFKNINAPARPDNILKMVERLPTPDMPKIDLKKAYYEDKAAKHGF